MPSVSGATVRSSPAGPPCPSAGDSHGGSISPHHSAPRRNRHVIESAAGNASLMGEACIRAAGGLSLRSLQSENLNFAGVIENSQPVLAFESHRDRGTLRTLPRCRFGARLEIPEPNG